MTQAAHFNAEANYNQFMRELVALTRKYGIAIESCGGISIAEAKGEFAQVKYLADITSGDLTPIFPEDDDWRNVNLNKYPVVG